MHKKRLFLIDGNSFCYRAYYAIKDLKNSKGRPTNAVYGFVAMLRKLIAEESPDYLGCAFDLKGPTFRHKIYEEYKMHRKPMPEELVSQLPIIKDIVRAYNIPIFEREGVEADDVLATIAMKSASLGSEVFIVTGDKDMLQVVDENIKIYSTHKQGFIYDKARIKERYNIGRPRDFVELIALMGDTADNIPGVPGIGEKTAMELISEFGSLEGVLSNIDKIKGKSRKAKLREFADQARLSRELATVDTDVPIEFDMEEFKLKEADHSKLLALFKELEFKNLIKAEIRGERLEGRVGSGESYQLVDSQEEFEAFLEVLKVQKEFAFDFETTSASPMEAQIVGVSFCWQEKEAFYIDFKKLRILEELRPVFEDEKIKKIGQNIKYEKIILSREGIELRGISFDTMVASYLLDPSKPNHNLEDISLEYLEYSMMPITELIGKGKEQKSMSEVEPEKVSWYSCEDSDITFKLRNILEPLLKEKKLDELFCSIEIPLIEVLARMEINGVAIDIHKLRKFSESLENTLQKLTKEIYATADCEFNINSPKQLAGVLFEKLKLPVVKRTKTGFSTNMEVLHTLSFMHPLPKALLKFREFTKLKNTYADALPALMNKETGRIHTSYNQTVTATGRLSSSEPNLQNIPVRSLEGQKIRKAFIAERSNLLLSADYSQIELRILAHLSGDEKLLEAFKEERDIHSYTASLIFGVEEEEVTEQMRATAKVVNFGIIYGMSAYGLSKELGISVKEAQNFIEAYFQRYPQVKSYIEEEIESARKKGYVLTLLNRRRYIPELNSQNAAMRQFAQRAAINTPIQGSSADIIKMAMIRIHKRLKDDKLRAKMILQVHDELIFELPKEELEQVKGIVKQGMENVFELKVPVKVSIKTGRNWLEME